MLYRVFSYFQQLARSRQHFVIFFPFQPGKQRHLFFKSKSSYEHLRSTKVSCEDRQTLTIASARHQFICFQANGNRYNVQLINWGICNRNGSHYSTIDFTHWFASIPWSWIYLSDFSFSCICIMQILLHRSICSAHAHTRHRKRHNLGTFPSVLKPDSVTR